MPFYLDAYAFLYLSIFSLYILFSFFPVYFAEAHKFEIFWYTPLHRKASLCPSLINVLAQSRCLSTVCMCRASLIDKRRVKWVSSMMRRPFYRIFGMNVSVRILWHRSMTDECVVGESQKRGTTKSTIFISWFRKESVSVVCSEQTKYIYISYPPDFGQAGRIEACCFARLQWTLLITYKLVSFTFKCQQSFLFNPSARWALSSKWIEQYWRSIHRPWSIDIQYLQTFAFLPVHHS